MLDGAPGEWLPPGFEVVPQRQGGLADRLAGAFAAHDEPALLIGMDTPQVGPELLSAGLAALELAGTDAVLGPAEDGGFWAIGLRAPRPDAFEGVPMSRADTGARQRARLRRLGLAVRELPTLRDVDYMDDARSVAAERPDGGFARALASLEPALV